MCGINNWCGSKNFTCTHTYIDKYTHTCTQSCAHIHTYIPSSLLPHPSSLCSSSPWHTSLLPLCTQFHACLETGKLPTVTCMGMIALSGRWTTLLKVLCSSHCFIVFAWWSADPYPQSNFSIIYCHFHCSSQDESGNAIWLWFQHDYTRREDLRNSNAEGGIQLWSNW